MIYELGMTVGDSVNIEFALWYIFVQEFSSFIVVIPAAVFSL